MNAQIRETILENAREMFNREGYDRVSMRALAEKSGIAVGNLTYYFPHKDDLVKAIMQDAFVQTKPEVSIRSFRDLTDQFARMLETVQYHAFYFLDDRFAQDQQGHNRQIRDRILEGLAYLQARGDFSDAFTPERREGVLEMLLLAHLTWVRISLIRDEETDLDAFLRKHWLLLEPYLTEQGRKAYLDLWAEK